MAVMVLDFVATVYRRLFVVGSHHGAGWSRNFTADHVMTIFFSCECLVGCLSRYKTSVQFNQIVSNQIQI